MGTSGGKFLEATKEHLETLVGLGLTYCQAKVYFATVQSGITNIKKISETTHIARPHIYHIINELEKLGLIEQGIEKPILIKPLPLQDAVFNLVNSKKQEIQNITQKAQEILQQFKNHEKTTIVNNYKTEFVWLSKDKPYLRKRHEEIDNAKISIDFISSWKRFPLAIYTFSENAKSALKRNVKIRVILEKPPNAHPLPNTIQELKKNPKYQLKYIHDPPLAIIAIFDRKRVILDASPSVGLAESPALWSNNPSLLAAMQYCYEVLWSTALKDP